LKLDNSSADLDIGDSEGNVILRLQDGHIKTKNFDSQNSGSSGTIKKSIKALFIGNSICQDHVTYLPYLLKNTYGDEIDFAIYIYYIGSCTIKKYATQISTIRAYIFSTAKNTEVWSNNTNNVKLTDALTADDFDIISF